VKNILFLSTKNRTFVRKNGFFDIYINDLHLALLFHFIFSERKKEKKEVVVWME
jgi:hypothetical protein